MKMKEDRQKKKLADKRELFECFNDIQKSVAAHTHREKEKKQRDKQQLKSMVHKIEGQFKYEKRK